MTDLIEAIPATPPPAPKYPELLAELQSSLLRTQQLPQHDTTAAVAPCAAASRPRPIPASPKTLDKLRDLLRLSSVKTNRTPVPKTIWYVWVGGEMPNAYADRIAAAAAAHPGWTVNVVLSSTFSASPEAYQANVDKTGRAGAVAVPLEGELAGRLRRERMLDPLIWEWKMTAGSDNVVNYGAISDILRVFVLKEQGGVYCDTDNTITTPLPDRLVPKYGFLHGVFSSSTGAAETELGHSFDGDPAAYASLWRDDATKKPSVITNSVLATVPHGQIINAYWDEITSTYTPLASRSESDRIAKLRWGPKIPPQGRSDAMKFKTLAFTGPAALEMTLGTIKIKGQNLGPLIRSENAWDVHTNDARHLILDPKHVYVRSDNSWVRSADAELAATTTA